MQAGSHITRQNFVMMIVIMLWIALTVRIGAIQLFNHELLHERALNQREKPVTIRGARGGIFDRNGVQLAINVESASYGIRPNAALDKGKTAAVLADATGLTRGKIREMLEEDRGFQWLVRHPAGEVMSRLDRLDLDCVERTPEAKRYYPLGKIAAQVIGTTDIDGRGIEGCECFLDDDLSGREGRIVMYRDAKHRVTPSLDEPIIPSQDGLDVVLTLDWRIQEIAEEELENGLNRYNARSGGVIVLDTMTGEILAMANAPRFDPNDAGYLNSRVFDQQFRKNMLVTDMIEPGSTFKIVTFIEALESGAVTEDDIIDCNNGTLRLGSHKINDTHEMGKVPVRDVLVNSSNIGTVKIAEKIGKERLYTRARLLGFGEVTGFDFPDETEGRLPNPGTWSKLSLPTISFGQGVAVSPLQISMAYAAIGNGGILLSPHIVKEVRGNGTRPERIIGRKVIRQALKPDTAARMTELLCAAVEEGTGRTAQIPNVRIGGKTGTAQRIREGQKGYVQGLYVSSFIGFVADRNPKILCCVLVDSPKGVYYGSQVAAPIFKNIVNRVLNMRDNPWAGMVAENDTSAQSRGPLQVPDMKGFSVAEAVRNTLKLGLKPVVVGDSTVVAKQFPLPGAELNAGGEVTLYSSMMIADTGGRIKVPNLIGKSMREAIQHLVQANLAVVVTGSGIVRSQNPPAGTPVGYGTTCTIICKKN